ncbi:MAG: hypothetical protein U5L96_06740 [Owenweeksia sp.]|nr:hypothetical protein [Owenweeksia sp.]
MQRHREHWRHLYWQPLYCAAALATIRIMKEQKLAERAVHIGGIIMDRMNN